MTLVISYRTSGRRAYLDVLEWHEKHLYTLCWGIGPTDCVWFVPTWQPPTPEPEE